MTDQEYAAWIRYEKMRELLLYGTGEASRPVGIFNIPTEEAERIMRGWERIKNTPEKPNWKREGF